MIFPLKMIKQVQVTVTTKNIFANIEQWFSTDLAIGLTFSHGH